MKKSYIHNPKTVADFTHNIEFWENTKKDADKRLQKNPHDPMTQASHGTITKLVNEQTAKLRAKRSNLIGKKES